MKTWCRTVLLILSMFAFSAMAESNSLVLESELITRSSASQAISWNQASIEADLKIDRLLGKYTFTDSGLHENKHAYQSAQLQLENSESSTNDLPFFSSFYNATLFRDNLQLRPVYWLKSKFTSPNLNSSIFTSAHIKPQNTQWFIHSNRRVGSRLSGWKDGNSLYSSSITYY